MPLDASLCAPGTLHASCGTSAEDCDMKAARRWTIAALACLVAANGRSALAQSSPYVDEGGIRYQLVQQQIPVTEMREQQQTVYRQQVTTESVQQQQLYSVPVTQYQLVARM